MKKQIFRSIALITALAMAAALLLALGLAYAFPGFPLLPWMCGGAGAALLAVMLILAAALSSRTTRRILRPLEEFSEHLDRDGPAQDQGVYPELAPILDKIRERQRDLRRQIGELTDNRDALQNIIGNMQKELEKQQENFSVNISHLRGPIASISGVAEKLETGPAPEEEVRRSAGLIRRESARLSALIDDMIRLARLDQGTPAPMIRVSLTSVCREVLTSLSLVAHRRRVGLKLTGPEVWTRGDAGMLNELMTILCDNAIQYNREGGSVLLETGSDPAAGTVWVTVRDTGVGIPADFFQHIFERFYRVDNSLSPQTEGTGLGLSIARRLADFHQGSISLESTLGEGSVFTVTLPAWREESAALHDSAAPDKAVVESGIK